MRLVHLEPRFLRYSRDSNGRVLLPYVDQIGEAQGIFFLCPKCFQANGGSVGTHGVICWSKSRGVPDDANPGPGRWRIVGTGFEDHDGKPESAASALHRRIQIAAAE